MIKTPNKTHTFLKKSCEEEHIFNNNNITSLKDVILLYRDWCSYYIYIYINIMLHYKDVILCDINNMTIYHVI